MTDIRIAAVVCRCLVGRVQHNLDRTRYWTRRARQAGAALVCFPELNLTGYSNREEIGDYAIRTDGPEVEVLVRIAVDEHVALMAGFAEKDGAGRLYASHMVVTPQGRTAIYRKLHLAPPETEHFSPGESLPVFEWSGVRFGIQLCYDAHFPELSMHMAEANVDAIFIPHASPSGRAIDKHESWMRHLPARAYDNGLFVIACNQSGDNQNGLEFPGNAVVFSPSGMVIASRKSGDAGLIVADLATDRLVHVRNHRMRYFLPNRRPELYRQPPLVDQLDP